MSDLIDSANNQINIGQPKNCCFVEFFCHIGRLAWRIIVWLQKLCGCAKKTDQVGRTVLQDSPPPSQPNPLPAIVSPTSIPCRHVVNKDLGQAVQTMIVSYLALPEFACWHRTCTDFYQLPAERYLNAHPKYVERMLHNKARIGLNYPPFWKKGAEQAARTVTKLFFDEGQLFSNDEVTSNFPSVKHHFTQLTKIVFGGGRVPDDLLSSILLPTITEAEIVGGYSRNDIGYPLLQHQPLRRLKSHTWLFSEAAISPTLPELDELDLHLVFNLKSNLRAIAQVGRFLTLQKLSLSFPTGLWNGYEPPECPDVCLKTLGDIAPGFVHLTHLSLSGNMHHTEQEVAAIAKFPALEHLAWKELILRMSTIEVLAKLNRLGLTLGLKLDALNDQEELQQQMIAITQLASLNIEALEVYHWDIYEANQLFVGTKYKGNAGADSLHQKRLIVLFKQLASKITRLEFVGSQLMSAQVVNGGFKFDICTHLSNRHAQIEMAFLGQLLGSMPKLTTCKLEQCDIDVQQTQPTPDKRIFEQVTTLSLSETRISMAAAQILSTWLPAIRSLNLYDLNSTKENTDNIITTLLNGKHVHHLNLHNTKFTSASIFHIATTQTALRTVDLYKTQQEIEDKLRDSIRTLLRLPLLETITLPSFELSGDQYHRKKEILQELFPHNEMVKLIPHIHFAFKRQKEENSDS